MRKNQQVEKNLKLSQKLANYMVKHPELMGKLPKSASYVVFTLKDEELNNLNAKLIPGLLEEGKKVVKAVQTNNKQTPWEFTQISA